MIHVHVSMSYSSAQQAARHSTRHSTAQHTAQHSRAHSMCLQDALDLYGAWRVIVGVHPKLPEAPRLRAQWLLMLAHGALDARAHVDQFQSLLALLWGALRHSDPAARAAAAAAIAQYPLDLLEELEASQPLSELCGVRRLPL